MLRTALLTWYLLGPALAAITSLPSTSAYRLDGGSSQSAVTTCDMNAASVTIMASVVVYDSTEYLQLPAAAVDTIAYSETATNTRETGFIVARRREISPETRTTRVLRHKRHDEWIDVCTTRTGSQRYANTGYVSAVITTVIPYPRRRRRVVIVASSVTNVTRR